MTGATPVSRVAVCGAGAMGCGIAQLAATAGASVTVFDVNAQSLAGGAARIETDLGRLVARAKITADESSAILGRLRWTKDLADIGEQDLVIEAVIEDQAIKQSLFADLETVIGECAILVTNTSSIPVARLARDVRGAGRFAGMHFFNPATVMKLVEVIAAPDTDETVLAVIEAVARSWGKLPVRVADVPGFIVNRVARPFYAEGFRALQEGVDPVLIDLLFREAAGYRMGPLELADMIGHDVNFAVARSVYDSYFGQTRFVPQLAQAALVDSGRFGRKTGRGIYAYDGSQVAAPAAAASAAEQNMMAEGGLGAVLAEDGAIRIMVTHGATAAEESRRAGRPVVLVDWRAATGKAVGFAAADDVAGAAAEQIAGWGVAPYRLPDRPGLVVARTLAQIANAAGDAVLERVSDEAGIDTALQFGANYPFGAFAWADRVGRPALAAALAEIAAATGQPLYAPSEYWSRQ